MMTVTSASTGTGLLVSVRSAAEALEALAGGADVIDVKEPMRGSLGAADVATMADVVRTVDGRAMVTVALGELRELASTISNASPISLPTGVSLFKIGLAGCRLNHDWPSLWRDAIGQLLSNAGAIAPRQVAVVYADWISCNAPAPDHILEIAIEARCPALLVDTWDKSSGALFDHWPADELGRFVGEVRAHGIATVLAGSLVGHAAVEATRIGPDLIAVRTAACDNGRTGRVSRQHVRALKQLIAGSRRPNPARLAAKKFP